MRTISNPFMLGILAVAAAAWTGACGRTESTGEAPSDAEDRSIEPEEHDLNTARGSVQAAVQRRLQAKAILAQDPAAAPAVERLRGRRGAGHDFAVRSVVPDEGGRRHVRVEHRYGGVRVLSSTALLHLGPSGDTESEDLGGLKEGVEIDTAPRLTEAEARAVVEARPERVGRRLIEPLAELVIAPEVKRFVRATGELVRGDEQGKDALDVERRVVSARLAYQIDTLDEGIGEPFASRRYLVDARTGEVFQTRSLARSSEGTGKSFKSDGPAGDFDVPVDTQPRIAFGSAFFEPFDAFRNFGVWDEDACHTCGANRNPSNVWGDGTAFAGDAAASSTNRRTAIADGLYGMQVTWDMFANVFSRQGYDDAFYSGNAYVHSDTNWDDAAYYSLSGNIAVGDGPPANRSNRTTLDTLAHEFGHGINDFTAGLGDDGDPEAEGLNEAAADIIGEITEAYERGNGAFNNLLTIPASPGPTWRSEGSGRDFKSPGVPDAWSAGLASLPDEHTRALPMDHAFFFLSQGSINNPLSSQFSSMIPWGMDGIGINDATQIWIRALTMHMTTDTDYAGARVACLQAAAEKFGNPSPQRDAVMNAFAGIGVGTPAPGYPGDASTMSESEPNGALTPDLVVMPASLPAGAPVNGALSSRRIVFGTTSSSDTLDHFVFSVPAGKSLRVTLRTKNDSKLTLFDQNGNVVDEEPNIPGAAPEQRRTGSSSSVRTFTARVGFVADVPGVLVPMYSLYIDFL